MKILFSSLLLISIFSTASVAQIPSTIQTDWCGGPSPEISPYHFGNCFLEQENTGWVSQERLTLGYPAANMSVFSSLVSGAEIVAGDFDCDGFTDIAAAQNGEAGTILVLQNPGAGSTNEDPWQGYSIASGLDYIRSLSSCDMDGDGDEDIVAVHSYSAIRTLVWLENPGFAGTWLSHHLGDYPGLDNIDCGDFDQDGDMDIACTSMALGCDTVSVLVNNGDSWTRELVDTEGNGPIQVKFVDINSNGSTDILAVYAFDDKVSWFEREPSGRSWEEHEIMSFDNPRSAFPGDFNGNGTVDVLTSGLSEGSAYLCENLTGSGDSWNSTQIMQNSVDAASCILADLDSDGDLDAILSQKTEDLSILFTNNGQSPENWFRTNMYTSNPMGFAVLDSDEDGFPEAACLTDGEVRLLSARPGTFQTMGSLTSSIACMPAGTDVMWGNILWHSWTPAGTSVSFQLRASEDPANMGEWSQIITEPGTYIGGFMPEEAWFIQYRVFLSSDDPDTSPYLYSIEIEGWNPGGTEESSSLPAVSAGLCIGENPSTGNPAISVLPLENCREVLLIFDITGREVYRDEIAPSSETVEIELPDLPSGTYTAVLRSRMGVDSRKFCIIR